MSHSHHHHDCDHALAFCRRCDVAYCTKCDRQWGTLNYWYSAYYPATTTTITPTWANSPNDVLTATSHSEH